MVSISGSYSTIDRGTYTEYRVNSNSTIRVSMGSGDVFENALIDVDASGAALDINVTGSNWTIRDVGVRGEDRGADTVFMIGCSVSAGSTGRIERVYLGDGDEGTSHGDGEAAIYVSPSHAGTLELRNVYIEGHTDNGLYASDPGHEGRGGGQVHVYDSYSANNTASNFRLGTDGSFLDNCCSWGGPHRGYWAYFEHTEVRNCHLGGMSNPDRALEVGEPAWDKSGSAEVTAIDSYFEGYRLRESSNQLHGTSLGTPQQFVPAGTPTTPEDAASGTAADEPTPPPDAEYELITVGAGERFEKSLANGETWENKLIDISAEGAGYRILATGTDWTIRNVGVRGTDDYWEHNPDTSHFGIDVPSPGATGLVENVYLGDGDTGSSHGDGGPGLTVHGDLSGEVTLRNVHVAGHTGPGLDASEPGLPTFDNPGTAVVRDSYFSNNTAANVRLGTREAEVRGVVSWGGPHRGHWQMFGHADIIDSHFGGMDDPNRSIEIGEPAYDEADDASVEVFNTRFDGHTLRKSSNTLIGESAGTPAHFLPLGVPEDAEAAARGGSAALPPAHLTSAATQATDAAIWREDQEALAGYTYRSDFRLRDRATDGEADFGYLFGIQDGAVAWDDITGYIAFIDTRNNELRLDRWHEGAVVDSGGTPVSASASVSGGWPTGERLRLTLDWRDSVGGTITATVADATGTELVSVDLEDDAIDRGYVGFYRWDAGPDWLVDTFRASGIAPDPADAYESWGRGDASLDDYIGDTDDYRIVTGGIDTPYALTRATDGHARIMYDGPLNGPARGSTFAQSWHPTSGDDILMTHFAADRAADGDRYAVTVDYHRDRMRFGARLDGSWSWVDKDLTADVSITDRWMDVIVDFGESDPDNEQIEVRYERRDGTPITSLTASLNDQGGSSARNGGVWGYSLWNETSQTDARVDHLRDLTEVSTDWQTTSTQTLTDADSFSHVLTDLETGSRYEYRAVARSPTGTTVRGDTVRFTPEADPDPAWDITGPFTTVTAPTEIEQVYPADDGTGESYFEPGITYEYRLKARPTDSDETIAAGSIREFTLPEVPEDEPDPDPGDPVDTGEWIVVDDFSHRNMAGFYNGSPEDYKLTEFWSTSGDVSVHNATDRAGPVWTTAPDRLPRRGDTIRFDCYTHYGTPDVSDTLRIRFRFGIVNSNTFLDCYLDIERREILAAENVGGQWTVLGQGTTNEIWKDAPFYGEIRWRDDGAFEVEFFSENHNSLSDRLVARPNNHDASTGGVGFVIFSRETGPITTARIDNIRVR